MKEHSKASKTISRRKFLTQTGVLSTFFIVPRSVLGGKGFLAPSDRMIMATRRRLLDAARALTEHGTAPPGVDEPEIMYPSAPPTENERVSLGRALGRRFRVGR